MSRDTFKTEKRWLGKHGVFADRFKAAIKKRNSHTFQCEQCGRLLRADSSIIAKCGRRLDDFSDDIPAECRGVK